MFNKFALAFTGLMLTVSSVGCCCLGGGYGAGYGYRPGGCPPCPNTCSPMGTAMYSQSQTAFAPADMATTAYVPANTAYAPMTTTALAPIQGPAIMSTTAVVPGATLPLY